MNIKFLELVCSLLLLIGALPQGSVQQPRHQTLPAMETVSDKTQHITAAVTMLRDCIRNDDLPLLPDVYQKVLQASQGVASLFPEVRTECLQKFN